jgi:P4 family phage/plasmid primase-like protien
VSDEVLTITDITEFEVTQKILNHALQRKESEGLEYSQPTISNTVRLLKAHLTRSWGAEDIVKEQTGFLAFLNGVLALSTGELLPHSPSYLFRAAIPRNHNPAAQEFPKIKAWLDEVTSGNEEIQWVLLCFIAAVLEGMGDLQKFLHLEGPPRSGKGTFIRLLLALVGESNCHFTDLRTWNENRFEQLNALGKMVVFFADEKKYTGDTTAFQKLTGGDPLRAEIKGGAVFPFRFRGLVVLASNHACFLSDREAVDSRSIPVPFPNQVPEENRRNLEPEFESELPALTNFCLAIPDDSIRQVLVVKSRHIEAIERTRWEARIASDYIAHWVNQCLIPDAEAKVQIGRDGEEKKQLYGSYVQFTRKTGGQPKGSQQFISTLETLLTHELKWNVRKGTIGGNRMGIYGVRLVGEDEDPSASILGAELPHLGLGKGEVRVKYNNQPQSFSQKEEKDSEVGRLGLSASPSRLSSLPTISSSFSLTGKRLERPNLPNPHQKNLGGKGISVDESPNLAPHLYLTQGEVALPKKDDLCGLDFYLKASKLFDHMNFGKTKRENLYRWLNLPANPSEWTDEHYQKLVDHLETLRANEDRETGQWVQGIWIPQTSPGYRPRTGDF